MFPSKIYTFSAKVPNFMHIGAIKLNFCTSKWQRGSFLGQNPPFLAEIRHFEFENQIFSTFIRCASLIRNFWAQNGFSTTNTFWEIECFVKIGPLGGGIGLTVFNSFFYFLFSKPFSYGSIREIRSKSHPPLGFPVIYTENWGFLEVGICYVV